MKTGLNTVLFGRIFSLPLAAMVFSGQGHAAVSVANEKSVPSFNFSAPSVSLKETATKKITGTITLKLNRDLFEKGLEVQTDGYGQYFANLEASNHFEAKFRQNPAQLALKRKMRQSSISGAMRLGGFVTEKSKVYLKVGFESENFAGANTLKTRGVNGSNQGYWRTVMASGVGFEYGMSQKWSVLGEASTMALTAPINAALEVKSEENSSESKTSKFKGRDNRVLLGFRYRFGG